MKGAMNSVFEFVNGNKELNVVLIDSPHSFDILRESCVNQEVIKFNRQILKIMEHQSGVKILASNLDRNCFTTHGLHLNTKGKKLVSQDLAWLAQPFFNEKQILSTISTPRKDPLPPVTSSDSESQDLKIVDETNWLFLLITEESAQQGEIQIFCGRE
jgi:hypothetical protein